jgi:valyl-tRNA synthetase
MQRLVRQVTLLFQGYEYAAAKNEVEVLIWGELADNYLEMAKLRLYDPANPTHAAACYTLYHVLLTTLKLLAPILPHVTEAIYRPVFAPYEPVTSIHISRWPTPDLALENDQAEAAGEILVNVATAVRRYKSEAKLPLGTELARMQLVPADTALAVMLGQAADDLQSITRAKAIEICEAPAPGLLHLAADDHVAIAIGI